MNKYTVIIKETLEKCILVDAESEHDAIDKVYDAYRDEHIILDGDDFCDVDFNAIKTTTQFEYKHFKSLEDYIED